MFVLRRVSIRARSTTLPVARGSATLQCAERNVEVTPPAPPYLTSRFTSKHTPTVKTSDTLLGTTTTDPACLHKTSGRNRKFKCPPRRPPISSKYPRKWNRPLALGVLPAYDEALKVIKADSSSLKKEAKMLASHIDEEVNAIKVITKMEEKRERDRLLEVMREKLEIIEVQSEVNLPEVRWNVSNAMVDMLKPVHRHLVEQRWRKDGGLDLLMERIHQMKVIPDVLPDFHPSFDLQITAMTPFREYSKTKKMYMSVVPGVFLRPEQTRKPPKLYANVFHVDTRLYTMILVDPDVPDEENETFRTYLHWMKPNIPLSATHQTRILDLNTHTRYIPPHPQRGTPYHRYVLLLLPQPPKTSSSYTLNDVANANMGSTNSQHLEIPLVSDSHRLGFDVRAFVREWELDRIKGGGAHMWREVWSQGVSRIYRDLLKGDEPRYGVPPKVDPYADVKRMKRYL